jgi:hypothetical protein
MKFGSIGWLKVAVTDVSNPTPVAPFDGSTAVTTGNDAATSFEKPLTIKIESRTSLKSLMVGKYLFLDFIR